jgi:aminoglycoside 6-adenylyltransferase
MRTEQQMLNIILGTAREDERIRAVVMQGSRANPNAPRDFFQDFDIVYFVTDLSPFRRNLEWITRFGELMILQLPDDMRDPPPADDEGWAYLMQFADGNRIDLGIYPLHTIAERIQDSQTIILLDKDGLIPALPPASDRDYLPQPPTAKQFADCCNEFWWCSPYIAKGLWRDELPYAKEMQDLYVRAELNKVLKWHIGLHTNFKVSPGKMGKYFHKYLESELWAMLEKTYSGLGCEEAWESLFAMCRLFRALAVPLAEHYGFEYPSGDDQRVSAHLAHVHTLPRDAQELYPS